MKKYVSASSREEIIDEIDKGYYNEENWELVEEYLEQVSGKSTEYMDDSDPEEGFYANFTDDELIEVLALLRSNGNMNTDIDYMVYNALSDVAFKCEQNGFVFDPVTVKSAFNKFLDKFFD